MLTAVLQLAGLFHTADAQRPEASDRASTYVPLDSWVYPALERLAAQGTIATAFLDLRPWTRADCARWIEGVDASPDTISLLQALRQEFEPELHADGGVHLESLSQRVTTIAGTPLRDGFHFAQTTTNDDGRDPAQGYNSYTAATVRASSGHFAAYVRLELQRDAAGTAPSALAQTQIAAADFSPAAASGPVSGFLRGRVLDAYASFAGAGNQISFGQQSLWWGPARSSSILFSNNAEPIDMLRYDRVRPFVLPGFLGVLGSIRTEFLVGRLSGAQFVHTAHMTFGIPGKALGDQPFIHGQKFSFRPTPNFEFGISRTVLFGGAGAPVTTHTFLRSLFSAGTGSEGNDPGDRRSAFDATYKIPGMRRCLFAYVDTFTDDQPFPLVYPTESTWISGFDLTCIPHASRLSLRAEGLIAPHRNLAFPGFYYFNVHYLSGYTNSRQLIGSWIGREAHAEQAWLTYQLSPRTSFEFSERSMTVASEFLQGGSVRDIRAAASLQLRPEWNLHLEQQVERWRFPLLSSAPRHNGTFTLQLTYVPSAGKKL